MAAAERFAAGDDTATVAKVLWVHVRSVQRWRSAWAAGGEVALVSKGLPNHPQLTDEQFAVLEVELARGPMAHGWPDQTWTLARIKTLIGRRLAGWVKETWPNVETPGRRSGLGWSSKTWPGSR
jgi:transposase